MRNAVRVGVLGAVAALGGLVACGSSSSAKPVTVGLSANPANVFIEMRDGAGNHLGTCSGTLVSSSAVLTAGHCIVAAEEWIVTTPDGKQTAKGARVFTVWKDFDSNWSHPQHSDVGVILLDQTIFVSKYPKLAQSLTTDGTMLSRVRRTDAYSTTPGSTEFIDVTAPVALGQERGFPLAYTVLPAISETGTDTGGALYDPDSNTLYGVVSGRGMTTGLMYVSRVDYLAEWITAISNCPPPAQTVQCYPSSSSGSSSGSSSSGCSSSSSSSGGSSSGGTCSGSSSGTCSGSSSGTCNGSSGGSSSGCQGSSSSSSGSSSGGGGEDGGTCNPPPPPPPPPGTGGMDAGSGSSSGGGTGSSGSGSSSGVGSSNGGSSSGVGSSNGGSSSGVGSSNGGSSSGVGSSNGGSSSGVGSSNGGSSSGVGSSNGSSSGVGSSNGGSSSGVGSSNGGSSSGVGSSNGGSSSGGFGLPDSGIVLIPDGPGCTNSTCGGCLDNPACDDNQQDYGNCGCTPSQPTQDPPNQ